MAEVLDLSSLPSHLQPNQYGVLALITLFSLSHGSGGSETAVGPYQIAFIVLAVWYGPSVIKEDVIPQKYGPLAILVGLMSLYGPWKLPLGDFSQPYHLHSILLALLVHYAPEVIHQHFLGTNNKYVLLGLAYFLAPSSSGNGTLFEPYLQWIIVASGLCFTIAFTSANIGPPLLWAYPDRSDLYEKVEKKVPSWTRLPFLVLLFHPWTRWWIIPFALAAVWQYIRFNYRIVSQPLLTRARSAVARAVADAARLRSEATSLESLSFQAHTLAANIGQDALAAHYIRLGDFYSESTHAWAKLGDFRIAIDEMASNADKLFIRTNDLRKKVPRIPNIEQTIVQMANSVYDSSKAIAREGNEFQQGAKRIQAKTERFERAAKEADSSRAAHVAAATTAKTSAGNISSASVVAWEKVWDADRVVEKLQDRLRVVEDEIAAGNKYETEKTVEEMEKIKPAVTPAVVQSVPAVASTARKAEAEMKKIYAIEFPAALPAAAKEIESDEKSYDSEDSSN